MSCVDTVNVCIIRGNSWTLSVGVGSGWEDDVLASPDDYQFNMILRLRQDDRAPVYVDVSEDVVINEEAISPEPKAYAIFTLPPATTQTLPPRNIVGLVDLVNTVTGSRVRLFDMCVDHHD